MRIVGLIGRALILLGLGTPLAAAENDMAWPDLLTSGYISGRAATVDDAKAGNAIFSMNGKSVGAVQMAIPQYVLWSDEQGRAHPMILVQAEKAPDGTEIVGLRDFQGGETAATMAEIKLLGTKRPE